MIFLLLVLTAIFSGLMFNSKHPIIYDIYLAKKKGSLLQKILREVPNNYLERVELEKLEIGKGVEVINVVDRNSSVYSNFIVLRNRNDNGHTFLKAYPVSLVGNKPFKEEDFMNHVSRLISLDAFNLYIQLKGIKKSSEIINKYVYFLSIPNDKYSYKKITHKQDIKNLLIKRPPEFMGILESTGFPLLDIEDLHLEQEEGIHYYWIYNKGLVKFRFVFNENCTVKNVESEILGFLGNEPPVCC